MIENMEYKLQHTLSFLDWRQRGRVPSSPFKRHYRYITYIILYTFCSATNPIHNASGEIGMPKSVMLTHANVGANVSQNLHPGSHTNHSATGILHLVIFLDKIE